MEKKRPLKRREVISEISKEADVRIDVVEDVLEAFGNIAIEEIANKGSFSIKSVLSVTSSEWGAYTAGKDYKVPKHRRLLVRISRPLRELHKRKVANPDLEITRNNWREVLGDWLKPNQKTETQQKQTDPNDYNPFLDDDDDE